MGRREQTNGGSPTYRRQAKLPPNPTRPADWIINRTVMGPTGDCAESFLEHEADAGLEQKAMAELEAQVGIPTYRNCRTVYQVAP